MTSNQLFGASISVKQARAFGLGTAEVIDFVNDQLGTQRFRLMSYWNEIEKQQGEYDFAELDQQLAAVEQLGGQVTLCIGMRQPRWPETHMPKWAKQLEQTERYQALYKFIETVMRRYQDSPTVVSWQLENEALNRGFGRNGDYNRQRLRVEANLVRELDPSRPLIMSLSDTVGLPVRRPRPDSYAVSFYRVTYRDGAYRPPRVPWWAHPLRARLIKLLTGRPTFIHELQLEPWGPGSTWDMSVEDQAKSMDLTQIKENLRLAKQTKMFPIDMWGAEWWLWRAKQGDDSIIRAIKQLITDDDTD